jgi:hypothetical protein
MTDRKVYLKLYNRITDNSRTDLEKNLDTNTIIDLLYKDIQIYLFDLPSQRDKINEDIKYMFQSIDNADTNFVGKINIISLQCIILFTDICHDSLIPFKVNINNSYNTYIKLFTGDWKNYSVMKSYLQDITISGYYNVLYPSKTQELTYIIVMIKYFTLDEIITSFLDNIIFCGITLTNTYADSRYMTPFEFVEHDIVHGSNYQEICYERIGQSKDNIKSFYDYCKIKNLNKSDMYCIKFMIFLLIHETWCDFFPTNQYECEKLNNNIIFNAMTNTGLCKIDRFINLNDLGLTIPPDHRTDKESIIEYLKLADNIYLRELSQWNELYRLL